MHGLSFGLVISFFLGFVFGVGSMILLIWLFLREAQDQESKWSTDI
jgi:hypothetical protein